MRRKISLTFIVYLMLIFCLPFMVHSAQEPKRGILVEGKVEKTYSSSKPYQKSVAVVIGIDDYLYWPKLSNAVNDAKDIKNLLKKQGFRVYYLYDSEATAQNIRDLLADSIPKLTGENDRLLVFYAGHGETRSLPDGGKEGFIVPVEGKVGEYGSLIPIDYFKWSSKAIPAKHQLFILDSCFSGLALDKPRGKPQIKDYIKGLTRGKARQIIVASTEDQLALDGTTGNSVFTKSLLEAIRDGRADLDADGVVTANALGEYLRKRVSLDSGQRQTPIFGYFSGHQFDEFLFFVKKINEKKIDFPVVNKPKHRKTRLKIPRRTIADNMEQMQMERKMVMYEPVEVDGCTDYHCRKCTDRDRCSLSGKECSHPNCGHIHGAVLCHGGVLFYLRSSKGTGYFNCSERAKSVAGKLNSAMQMATHKNYKFELEWAGNTPTIWHMTADGSMRKKIVTITTGDVMGYEYRAKTSDRSLEDWKFSQRVGDKTAGKIAVAEWWLAMLTDHFKLMAQSAKPAETITTHYGHVLYKMWELAREKHPSGPFPMSIWSEVVNELSQEDRDKLYLAARIIPRDFAESRIKYYLMQ